MKRGLTFVAALVAVVATAPASAVFIGNIDGGADFPQGAISFADAVVSYTPGSTLHPLTRDPSDAVGLPNTDISTLTQCQAAIDCPFVSLGIGGSLILRFIDNVLTGSGSSAPDLFIFETGPLVQGTFVAISSDGINWSDVGAVGGSVRGIDIDQFGFDSSDVFTFVRLIDNAIIDQPDEQGESLLVLGADIDAVGAISTVFVPIPPAALLLLSGLAGVIALGRRRVAARA
jgi:hypothetical protein